MLELDRRYGRLAATLSNADLRAAFVPAIRADFTICEIYHPSRSEALRYPIIAYGGTADSDVTPDQIAGWRAYTTESFTMNTLPGITTISSFIRSLRRQHLAPGRFPAFPLRHPGTAAGIRLRV